MKKSTEEPTGKTMILSNKGNCWIAAHFEDGKPEERILELMGTHRIPTPFTPSVSGQIVKARLEKSNPDYTVILAEDWLAPNW